MALNKATRVPAVICWILIVTCGYRLCEHNERNFFPNARGLNLQILRKQTAYQATEHYRHRQILTDREARALNQRAQTTTAEN